MKKTWLRGLFFTRLIREILMETRSIPGAVKTFKTLMAHHREAHGTALFGKIAGVDGRYFAHLFTAGAPSAASRKVRQQEIRRVTRPESPPGLRTLMLAITKRCPLSCEHCYEADIMRGDEVMGRDDLLEIILRFKEAGTAIIWLGGGEPMSRFKDIRYLLQHAGSGMDVWVITSGYRLNEQTARALKTDGLTGAMISLDHWDPEEHNRFRGSAQAFGWAEQACKASAKAGLVAAPRCALVP